MTKNLLVIFIIYLIYCKAYGQSINTTDQSETNLGDSLMYEYDTVVIEKKPLIINKKILIETKQEKKRRKPTDFSADIHYSPIFPNKSEKIFPEGRVKGSSIGALFNVKQNHKLVSLGFSYTQIKGLKNSLDTVITTVSDSIITDSLSIQNGDSVIRTIKVDSVWKKKNNRIRYIELPVLFGLYTIKGKTTFYIRAGGILGIPITTQQSSVSSNEFEGATSNKISINKVNFSLYVGGSISYQAFRNLGIFAEPYLRYGLTPIYLHSSTKGKLTGTGIKIGLNYFF